MCGASLIETEEVEEEEEKDGRRLPGWVSSVVVVLLASAILAGGGFGLYSMLAAEPEPTSPPVTPTPTATPTATPEPTDTPVPTATPTPVPPRAHRVEEGETVSDIATAYDVTVDEILALNPDVDPELINPGQVLLIPAAAPSGVQDLGESGSGTDSQGAFTVHVVTVGETLSTIAEEYEVPVSLIRTANDLSPDDETIRSGQSLVIPLSTPTPTVTPTPPTIANATSTATAPYAPPPLLHPPDGMVLSDADVPILLQWASVSLLRDNEWYELSLELSSGAAVSDTIRTRATAWRVPRDLLERAGSGTSRFEWRVRVVREVGEDIYEGAGATSELRSFVWREATPLPTPTPTP